MISFHRRLKNIGPGAMVAAAFIGPGTLTTCITAGVESGYSLLWAVAFSTVSCIILQEMTARIGVVTHQGLGKNIMLNIYNRFTKILMAFLIIVSILVGNCAFETGNIIGTAMGINMLFPDLNQFICVLGITVISIALILTSTHRIIETILTYLVFLMAIVFLILAFFVKPDLPQILRGLFVPSFGKSTPVTVVGLIGTTIGPYSLFLHSSSAAQKWFSESDIKKARIDTVISIAIGGFISGLIIVVTAASFDGCIQISDARDLSLVLKKQLGEFSSLFLGIGLGCAGFSSTLTAALGAGYATSELLCSVNNRRNLFFKMICAIVIVIGCILSIAFGSSPIELILFAQVTNAIILPIISAFVLYCANSEHLGDYRNGKLSNCISVISILMCIIICCRSLAVFISQIKRG